VYDFDQVHVATDTYLSLGLLPELEGNALEEPELVLVAELGRVTCLGHVTEINHGTFFERDAFCTTIPSEVKAIDFEDSESLICILRHTAHFS